MTYDGVRTAFLNWRFLVNVYDLRWSSIVRAAASIDEVLNYDKQSSPIQLGRGIQFTAVV